MKRLNQAGKADNCFAVGFEIRMILLLFGVLLLAAYPAGAQTITTFAGNGVQGFSGDGGPAVNAALDNPHGIAVDAFLNVYIADVNNNRIRKVAPNGFVTTFAGTGVAGFNGDNIQAASAQLNQPEGVAVDTHGNLIIADAQNRRIRRVAPNGIITTIAGTGIEGFSGDGGPATSANIGRAVALAADKSGNIFFADAPQQRVRVIAANGIIATVAGNGNPGFSGDGGPATSATLNFPDGVGIDNGGNLLIADSGNHVIRRVSGGIITTIAGNGNEGFSGDGGPATAAMLNFPASVTVDNAGNILIADTSNNRVRIIVNGNISTIAGTGLDGFSGDGGPATAATMTFPSCVVQDPAGNILIADQQDMRVREILAPPAAGPTLPAGSIVNGANFRAPGTPGGAVAPGTIVSIFGSNLALNTALAPFVPLPTTLLNTKVTFNGIAAPLFFVSKGQINAQVPFEVAPGAVNVQVTSAGQTSATQQIPVASVSPGVFTTNQAGSGDGDALHAQTFQLVTPANPAVPGEFVLVFGTGFGPTSPTVASGTPAPGAPPFASTQMQPTISVNGIPATFNFSGLAPNFVGLYQVNIQVPANTPPGANPVSISINGVASNTFTLETK